MSWPTLQQLRYFVAIADSGSFSVAADQQFVSQPALSAQIKELERLTKPHYAKLDEFAVGDRHFFFKPVTASSASCLDCHKSAKMGDTLGLVLYSVEKRSASK